MRIEEIYNLASKIDTLFWENTLEIYKNKKLPEMKYKIIMEEKLRVLCNELAILREKEDETSNH